MVEHHCIFCAIVEKALPAKIILENETVLAFQDIHPAAPHHILVIPKIHIASISELNESTASIMGGIALMAKALAEKFNLTDGGYRVVLNTGRGAGQTVFHLHAHVLSGRDFSWPPG